jgi:hypothetical protein
LRSYPRRHPCRVIIFCKKHGLSPSVKAGGYGTGGWAINGDVVIDLSKIQDIDIEPPQRGGDEYTSLRDTAQSVNKGKARVGEPVPDSSGPATRKRLFEGEAEQDTPVTNDLPIAWLYSTASAAVASFLHGPALPPDDFGEEPRRVLVDSRGLGIDGSALTVSTSPPVGEHLASQPDNFSLSLATRSGSGSGTSLFPSASGNGWSTLATTPTSSSSPQPDSALSAPSFGSPFALTEPFETAPSRPDPFAYMDNAEPPMFVGSPFTSLASSTPSWSTAAALMAHPLFAGDMPSHLTRPVPRYTHAYVSFGAGAMQKDIDLFTATHPLDGDVVPYHVPLCV